MEETDIFKAVTNTCDETSALVDNELCFTCSHSKQDIVDAFKICGDILLKLKVLEGTPNEAITSVNAKLLGKKMSDSIVQVLKDFVIHEEESLFLPDEEIVEDDESEESQESTDSSSSEPSESEQEFLKVPPRCRNSDYIPLETKRRILQMADAHPKWSLQTIQKRGGSALTRKMYLKRWRKEVEEGCGVKEKYERINKWTLERFRQARQQSQSVTTRMLQQWAAQAAVQLNMEFKASETWATKFKKYNQIKQKKVTRCVESTSAPNVDNTLEEISEPQNCK